MEVLYWGIGTHLGLPWAQNKHGHVLGDVTDQGKAADDPTARGNELGGIALPFHCDGSDLVGLCAWRTGAAAGCPPSPTRCRIHNQLVTERPDLAAALYDELPYDFRGEQPPGGKPLLPRARVHRVGRPAVRALHPAVHLGLAAPPRGAAAHRAPARRCAPVEQMADDPTNHVLMELQPGDMQFINNYHVLHGRTAYEDDRGAGHVRHLKRLWLETTVLDQPSAVLRQQPQPLVREANRQPPQRPLTRTDPVVVVGQRSLDASDNWWNHSAIH